MLRVLLLVNLALAVITLAQAPQPLSAAGWSQRFIGTAAAVEPPLIASLALLCPLRRALRGLDYMAGCAAIVALELAIVLLLRLIAPGFVFAWPTIAADWIVTVAATGALLYYFNLRERAFSPALAEARLAALQARIRPHFLFNSITAVLGLIRSEPRRAETALEDLADLFRVLLREERKLVPLDAEVALCRRYLDIETLRLGERLVVEWAIDEGARDAAMPPLILQPLIENAVHHGIEPAPEGGTVRIAVARRGAVVEIRLVNPVTGDGAPARAGNHMALDNVRERLALHFDVEARLDTGEEGGEFRVRIVLPYRRYVERPGEGTT